MEISFKASSKKELIAELTNFLSWLVQDTRPRLDAMGRILPDWAPEGSYWREVDGRPPELYECNGELIPLFWSGGKPQRAGGEKWTRSTSRL